MIQDCALGVVCEVAVLGTTTFFHSLRNTCWEASLGLPTERRPATLVSLRIRMALVLGVLTLLTPRELRTERHR